MNIVLLTMAAVLSAISIHIFLDILKRPATPKQQRIYILMIAMDVVAIFIDGLLIGRLGYVHDEHYYITQNTALLGLYGSLLILLFGFVLVIRSANAKQDMTALAVVLAGGGSMLVFLANLLGLI